VSEARFKDPPSIPVCLRKRAEQSFGGKVSTIQRYPKKFKEGSFREGRGAMESPVLGDFTAIWYAGKNRGEKTGAYQKNSVGALRKGKGEGGTGGRPGGLGSKKKILQIVDCWGEGTGAVRGKNTDEKIFPEKPTGPGHLGVSTGRGD